MDQEIWVYGYFSVVVDADNSKEDYVRMFNKMGIVVDTREEQHHSCFNVTDIKEEAEIYGNEP